MTRKTKTDTIKEILKFAQEDTKQKISGLNNTKTANEDAKQKIIGLNQLITTTIEDAEKKICLGLEVFGTTKKK